MQPNQSKSHTVPIWVASFRPNLNLSRSELAETASFVVAIKLSDAFAISFSTRVEPAHDALYVVSSLGTQAFRDVDDVIDFFGFCCQNRSVVCSCISVSVVLRRRMSQERLEMARPEFVHVAVLKPTYK